MFIASGACCGCGTVFSYNPYRVPVIRLGLDGEGRKVPAPDGQPEPLCQRCFDAINDERQDQGLEPIMLMPDAYEDPDQQ